jgi:hypothetical protein
MEGSKGKVSGTKNQGRGARNVFERRDSDYTVAEVLSKNAWVKALSPRSNTPGQAFYRKWKKSGIFDTIKVRTLSSVGRALD